MEVSKWFAGTFPKMAQTVWSGLQYSLLSDEGEQLSPFYFCKEFVIDTIWGELNQKPIDTFGFVYDPEYFPKPSLTELRLLTRHYEDHEFVNNTRNCARFLNLLEKQLNFTPTKVEEVTNPPTFMGSNKPPVMFVSADAKWMLAPPLLSLYTMLLRVGMTYDKGSPWVFMKKIIKKKVPCKGKDDAWRLEKIYDTIHSIVKAKASMFGKDMKANWPTTFTTPSGKTEKLAAYDFHENAGIMCFANNKAKYICPHWYPKPEEVVTV